MMRENLCWLFIGLLIWFGCFVISLFVEELIGWFFLGTVKLALLGQHLVCSFVMAYYRTQLVDYVRGGWLIIRENFWPFIGLLIWFGFFAISLFVEELIGTHWLLDSWYHKIETSSIALDLWFVIIYYIIGNVTIVLKWLWDMVCNVTQFLSSIVVLVMRLLVMWFWSMVGFFRMIV